MRSGAGSRNTGEGLGGSWTGTDASSIWDAGHRRTTIGLLTLVTLIAFEAMAVGTAMPSAVDELDGVAWYAWPFSAFLVTSVVGMVVGGEVGDRRSPRAGVLAGVRVFAAGLLIAGVAQHMAVLVARPGGAGPGRRRRHRAAVRHRRAGVPSELRPRLFGAFAAGWVLPALIGPLAAGLVTTHVGWRGVFLGLLPLVAGASPCSSAPARPRAPRGRRLRTGAATRCWALLAGAGIAALQYAAQRLDARRRRPRRRRCGGARGRPAPAAAARHGPGAGRASRPSWPAVVCWPAPSSAWTPCCRSS